MNTNLITPVNGSVNVTIHKNYLKEDNSSYAKVQRTTAGMHNVIAAILDKTKVFDKASLVAAEMLFKEAILELLSRGISVNLFELGTLYPSAQGCCRANRCSCRSHFYFRSCIARTRANHRLFQYRHCVPIDFSKQRCLLQSCF